MLRGLSFFGLLIDIPQYLQYDCYNGCDWCNRLGQLKNSFRYQTTDWDDSFKFAYRLILKREVKDESLLADLICLDDEAGLVGAFLDR